MCLLKIYDSLTHPCPAAPPRGCYRRLVAFPRDLAWAPLAAAAAAAAAAAPVAAGAAAPSRRRRRVAPQQRAPALITMRRAALWTALPAYGLSQF